MGVCSFSCLFLRWKPVLNGAVNLRTDGIKMIVYIIVCKTENQQSILFKDRTSFCIVNPALLGIVLGTVQFDHKPCLCA